MVACFKTEEKENDRTSAVRTRSRQSSAGSERRRAEGDAHSRSRPAALAGKSLGGADRPGAVARVGSLCDRWEPGCGWNSEGYMGGKSRADRNKRDASRSSEGA